MAGLRERSVPSGPCRLGARRRREPASFPRRAVPGSLGWRYPPCWLRPVLPKSYPKRVTRERPKVLKQVRGIRARSSAVKSRGLIIPWSWVRSPPSPPEPGPRKSRLSPPSPAQSSFIHAGAASSRNWLTARARSKLSHSSSSPASTRARDTFCLAMTVRRRSAGSVADG